MYTKPLIAFVALIGMAGHASASILAPGALDGNVDSNFLVEGVTLNGGQYIFDDSFIVPPITGFYATSSDFANYTNPISITFPTAPAADDIVRVVVWNRSGSANYFNGVQINDNGLKFIEVPTDGVTSTFEFSQWTSQSDPTPASDWDFAIGGYRIFPDDAVYFQAELIPEPSSLALLALGSLALLRRR